jgi:CIC family chloride channel protein
VEASEGATRAPSDWAYYALAVLVGLLAGAAGSAFHLLVDGLSRWPAVLAERLGHGAFLYAAAAAIAAAMVCASLFLVRRFAPEAAGSGVQEMEGAMEGLRPVRWRRVLPVKFVGGVMALSAGLVAGREGPTIHIGASIAAAIAEKLGLGRVDLRGLLAAGAAAGLSAAFNAPLAAILFVIEETRRQFPYTFRTYTSVIAAAAASAVVTETISGTQPDLEIAALAMPLASLPAFAGLGVLLGGVGVLFNRVLIASLDRVRVVAARAPYLPGVVVGAAIGVLSLLLPEATGGGERLILRLIAEDLPAATLAAIAVLRFVGTMASYSCGVPGGIFAPILTLATAIGLAVGTLLPALVPLPDTAPAAFAIAAMGGLFSASIRAPLVGIVLVAELTGAYDLILPVLITCLVANLTADALRGRPIYEELLERTLRLAGVAAPPVPDGPEVVSSPVGLDETARNRPG